MNLGSLPPLAHASAGAYQAFRSPRQWNLGIYDTARGERLEKGIRRTGNLLKREIKEALKGDLGCLSDSCFMEFVLELRILNKSLWSRSPDNHRLMIFGIIKRGY